MNYLDPKQREAFTPHASNSRKESAPSHDPHAEQRGYFGPRERRAIASDSALAYADHLHHAGIEASRSLTGERSRSTPYA